CLGFATSATPSVVHFMPQAPGVTITQPYWDTVVADIGIAATYYWAVGDCTSGTFTPLTAWRSFTVSTCSATLTNPAAGASFTFPQQFSWSTTGNCGGECLAFATNPAPSTIYFEPDSSGVTISQATWNNIVSILGNA